MGIQIIKGKYYIYTEEISVEFKYRKELSTELITKFGKKEFNAKESTKIISYSLDYFISNFKNICLKETSVRFYQQIFRLHEQATEIIYKYSNENSSDEIDFEYIGRYRRILKFIIEMGCEVPMHNNEQTDENFKIRFENKINDLLYLGHMILTCVSQYAEQTMIEDVIDITFDENDYFIFSRKHHYNYIFEHMLKDFGPVITKTIIDDDGLGGFNDLKKALKDCFNIEYDNVGNLIASIHEMNKKEGGDVVGVGWETFYLNLHNLHGVEKNTAKHFFKGLTLDKSNKMDLLDLACKPYKMNRYIYKPIIIWNIDGADYALVGKNSWSESFIQFATNSIPWGKAPDEWFQNKCFKGYVHSKEDAHDKWLDNAVEEKLKKNNLMYDRNIKVIKHNSGITNIDVEKLGEIDFIIVSESIKKIFISDCKHLLGRYDIANQRNDYNAFTSGKKPYNETLKRKIKWFKENILLLEEHFKIKYPSKNIKITDYEVEGIFIINTPTFYMYNSDYRIYTIEQIEKVLSGKYIDPVFTIIINEEKCEKILNVKYPYFKKPEYIEFDPFKD